MLGCAGSSRQRRLFSRCGEQGPSCCSAQASHGVASLVAEHGYQDKQAHWLQLPGVRAQAE